MPGLSVITRKEISDAIANKTFLFSFTLLLISSVLAGTASGNTYARDVADSQSRGLRSDINALQLIIIRNLIPQVKVLGALLAIVLGFNSINKERTDGSLKTLLSYPIFRDQLIAGKLLGCFLIISMATVVSLVASLGVYLIVTNIWFNPILVSRFVVFILLSALLLNVYLGLSIFFAVALKKAKLALLSTFLCMGLLNSEIFQSFGNVITNWIYGNERFLFTGINGWLIPYVNPQARALQIFLANLNPSWCFTWASINLAWLPTFISVNDGFLVFLSELGNGIQNNLDFLAVLIVLPILTFVFIYYFFSRRDIF